jgi:hypothetical protein
MANMSRAKIIVQCGRNAGVLHPADKNIRIGGIYTPAHTNATGKPVSAKWNGSVTINHRDYKDAAGNVVKVEPTYIKLTAWSGKGAEGNGMAEIMSRCMSIGLEVCFEAEIQTYKGDVYKDNIRLMNADGTPFQVNKTEYVLIPGTLLIVSESDPHINKEVLMGLRPAGWNNAQSPDYAKWQEITRVRRSERYTPGKNSLGYALVVQPKGAQANAYAPVLGAGAPVLVKGFTYDQWKASNPNFDEVALANPDFAAFHNIIKSRMVAGTLATPPQAPTATTIVNTAPQNVTAFGLPY